LREKHIGRRCTAFGDDLRSKFATVAIADLDRDSGLGGEQLI
jgi:hypothetical protein